MKLVDDWRCAYKWASVQIAGAGALFGALGAGLAASMSAAQLATFMPTWAVWAGGALICVFVMLGRLLMRGHKVKPDDDFAG